MTKENRKTKLSERLEIVLVNTVNIGINTIVLYIVALKAKNLLMKEKTFTNIYLNNIYIWRVVFEIDLQ